MTQDSRLTTRNKQGMSLIVKTVTRITFGLMLLFGIYIILHGHLTPGGGFAGGVIIALSFIHIMLAFGKETAFKQMSEAASHIMESIGALLFFIIGVIGIATGGYFLLNFLGKGEPFRLFSAGIIPLCNIAIALKVGAGLYAVVVVLSLLRIGEEEEDGET